MDTSLGMVAVAVGALALVVVAGIATSYGADVAVALIVGVLGFFMLVSARADHVGRMGLGIGLVVVAAVLVLSAVRICFLSFTGGCPTW